MAAGAARAASSPPRGAGEDDARRPSGTTALTLVYEDDRYVAVDKPFDMRIDGGREGRLTLLTNAEGGILDDCVLANAGDYVYMVVNGACKVGDMAHLQALLDASGMDVQMHYQGDDATLVALQGAGAPGVLLPLLPDGFDMTRFAFMTGVDTSVGGYACRVTRCGYTGEDGFEIAVPKGTADKHGVVTLWETLLADTDVMPVGLGARDSLRLEAGLCLYGNDLDTPTSPAEGTLFWVVAKSRRVPGGFVGSERILEEITNKSAKRKRAGFVIEGAPARQGTAIMNADGDEIGVVTSGGHSPMLKKGIGMCYVKPEYNKAGTELYVMLRKKKQTITISKMPFVPQNYYRGP